MQKKYHSLKLNHSMTLNDIRSQKIKYVFIKK
jgi:hypothetical protein